MKPGKLVKHIHSGRIIKIKNIDDVGLNWRGTALGTQYDAFLEHVRELTVIEKIKYYSNVKYKNIKEDKSNTLVDGHRCNGGQPGKTGR